MARGLGDVLLKLKSEYQIEWLKIRDDYMDFVKRVKSYVLEM